MKADFTRTPSLGFEAHGALRVMTRLIGVRQPDLVAASCPPLSLSHSRLRTLDFALSTPHS